MRVAGTDRCTGTGSNFTTQEAIGQKFNAVSRRTRDVAANYTANTSTVYPLRPTITH
jgi:hypothetical protein